MFDAVESIKKYVRATNYLAATQVYLKDNFLLKRKLSFGDIKPRLLGHWGTCPGINFIYANLNYLIKKHRADILFIMGPGHGFAALQANLFLEGTLEKYYPEAARDEKGVGYVVKNFCWPYGFPSHSNPGAPGVILEGGELGYALSTAYGAVLDNPDLIAACVIGDGEAETGPLAASWHLNKLISPVGNGAVLPILHLNGYKISGPTIFGRMTNRELKALFTGYGYEPIIVEGSNVYPKMIDALEKSYQSIKSIRELARSNKLFNGDGKFPMIILKTPKGWTGIKKLGDIKMEGNFPSHQVPAPNAKMDKIELKAVEKWFRSYKFDELFSAEGGFINEIKEFVPESGLKMGESRHALGGNMKPLVLPPAEQFSEDAAAPGAAGSSSMRRIGAYLNEVFKLNKENKNLRLFSPDETYSNKLDAVFETTARAFTMPQKEWDKDLSPDGRVMELLSEHSLQGMAQGYALTGRHAVFASYEAFIQIVASMADQYAKFLKTAKEFPWRGDIPSFNYILTSSGWRQEHNGFSHQNPGFISDMLQKPGGFVRVFFPPDGNSALVVLKKCLASKNKINIIVAGKTLEPRWLTPELAEKELNSGMMIWDFASEENPHIIFAAAGDYLTKESLAAIDIVKSEAPEIKVRFVNVMELSALGNSVDFVKYFTDDKQVIFNFHGYPQTLKQFLFDYEKNENFCVHGYIENGSTTTPFDMQVRNETSRYHLAIDAFARMAKRGFLETGKAENLIKKYRQKLNEHREYIKINGVDPEEIENWQWKSFK
ncbi:MAG: phosphoketolase family protein [Candidatus Azambacteria bacterium]|nr:phosphoketolase family protein [Candidatus Azambacteria bacterium]